MTRNSRPTPASRPTRQGLQHQGTHRRGFGGTLLGVLVGVIIGVALAAGAAYYVMRSGNPYQPAVTQGAREQVREQGKDAKDGKTASRPAEAREQAKDAKTTARPADAPSADTKPRFDFYKILPGTEDPKVQTKPASPAPEKAVADRAAQDKAAKDGTSVVDKAPEKTSDPARAPKSGERIWLQVGSFAGQGDAENLKAQLALAGLEATIQTATIPDKGIRYRVRVGPYDNTDEVGRIKKDLAKRGFDSTVVK